FFRKAVKNDFAKQKGIPLIRIKYKDLNNIESVLQEELKKINIYIDINKTNVIKKEITVPFIIRGIPVIPIFNAFANLCGFRKEKNDLLI
ncbi:hypothetical protein P4473_06310, partial [Ureibacillus thermosphaericus]